MSSLDDKGLSRNVIVAHPVGIYLVFVMTSWFLFSVKLIYKYHKVDLPLIWTSPSKNRFSDNNVAL